MNDEQLADRVVALGVGNNTHDLYAFGAYHVIGCTFEDFVRDPRIAMALMERVRDKELIMHISRDGAVLIIDDLSVAGQHTPAGESLPRAITEASVKALS